MKPNRLLCAVASLLIVSCNQHASHMQFHGTLADMHSELKRVYGPDKLFVYALTQVQDGAATASVHDDVQVWDAEGMHHLFHDEHLPEDLADQLDEGSLNAEFVADLLKTKGRQLESQLQIVRIDSSLVLTETVFVLTAH